MPTLDSVTPNRKLLRALVMCDLVDSTALVDALDDETAARLMRRHDRMTRSVMQQYGGLEVDRTDGFLLIFESPTAAVEFALEYQRALRLLANESQRKIAARVGIHFGEVVAWQNALEDVHRGARPSEIDGLAIAVAARLTSLALPGQILVSEIAQHIARRVDRLIGEGKGYTWKLHGRYMLKGLADPISVYEAGEEGISPMRPPKASTKAGPINPIWRRRAIIAGGGLTIAVATGSFLYYGTGEVAKLSLAERDWVVLGDVVNINADPTLDAPLAAAFRIGLEESRYVNVIPAGAIRQALSRMQRNSMTTMDRDIASEIALRERARAVVVPSIAQYGGKLRIAVELVDPSSVNTVWTQSVDAAGTNELLAATDRLLRSLRSRLGESLPRIVATSPPLERAATPSIEALRAFSRAVRLEGAGDAEQAKRLLAYAVSIDSNFAAAYARMGAIAYAEQSHIEAKKWLQKALEISDRLSERERAFVAGVLSYYMDPPAMLSAWRFFSNLFPQWSNGPHNIGNVLYERFHDYAAAEKAYKTAVTLYNPYRHYTHQSLGHVLLAQEKYSEAEKQFRTAIDISPAAMLFGLADALAASGRYEDAERYLSEAPAQASSAETERKLRRMSLLVWRGQYDEAGEALTGLIQQASSADRWRLMFVSISISLAKNDLELARVTVSQLLGETSESENTEANLTATEHLLYGGYWAARLGLTGRAQDAIAKAQKRGSFDRYPVRVGLTELVRAQLRLNSGQAFEARRILKSSPSAGALWEAHELLADIAKAVGDTVSEANELQWLVARPGLALAQWIDQFVGQQLRILTLRNAARRLSTLKFARS